MTNAVENLTYGTLVGRYVRLVADPSGDVAEDVEPLAGTVTITCDAPSVVAYTPDDQVSGGYTDVTPSRITMTLDSDGYLTYNGLARVALLATDGALTNPTAFTYTATFNLVTQDGAEVPKDFFHFQVPGGTTVSLPGLLPVDFSEGTLTVQGPPGVPGTGLNVAGGAATFSALPAASTKTGKVYTTADTANAYYSDGATWVLLGTIQGPQGNVGPAPIISATADTLTAGQPATVTVSGDPSNLTLAFGIPPGPPGQDSTLVVDDTTTSTAQVWSSTKTSAAITAGVAAAVQGSKVWLQDGVAPTGAQGNVGDVWINLAGAAGARLYRKSDATTWTAITAL